MCIRDRSDAEVEYQDKPGHLWHMRYPLTDGSGYLVVATTCLLYTSRCV